jgi:hypothetical protein
MGAQPTCESCGQPVLMRSELPPLTKIQQKIFDAVKRRPGLLSAEQLREIVWDGPDGGPESRNTLFVHLAGLNQRLTALHIVVRSEAGKYRIRSIDPGIHGGGNRGRA